MKKLLVMAIIAVFSFTAAFALAADNTWVVVKDKKGHCKILKSAGDNTVLAGPFKTAKEAKVAKKQACKKAGLFHSKPKPKHKDKPATPAPEAKPDTPAAK